MQTKIKRNKVCLYCFGGENVITCTAFALIWFVEGKGGWRPQLHSINMQFGISLKPTKDSVIRIKRFQKEDIKIYFLKKKGRGKKKNAKIIQSWVFCSPLMWVVVSEISSLHRSCRVHVKALVLPGSSSSPEILMSTSFTCCGVMCLTSLLSLVWPWSCVLLTQQGEKCTGRVQRQTMNLTPQEKKICHARETFSPSLAITWTIEALHPKQTAVCESLPGC